MINTGVQRRNPFPGVRPFTSAEDKYFFGREKVCEEVKGLLLENRFVGLVGGSASGKTSLVQSGIIPALLSRHKEEWVPVVIRPGRRPVESLIRGFSQVFPKKIREADVQSYLGRRSDLGEMIQEKGLGSHKYCLVVDQFEELFRRGPGEGEFGKQKDAEEFVEQLVRLTKRERPMVHVICAIRSDFMDACTSFRSLTGLMNRGKYLLPQMTGEELTRAIQEPVRKAGVSLEQGFEETLLEELEEVEIQLPQLQHVLMRTWEAWMLRGEYDTPIALEDYRTAGPVGSALSSHLEEAYHELEPDQRAICEKMFKRLTSRSEQFNGFQRRASIGTIARIAQCSPEELVEVAEVFRRPGRSFVAPYAPTVLDSDTVIEISHESLITIWDRLSKWVSEEAESRKMYLRLSEASALYQQGRTELWRPPELQLALQWRENQKPSAAWGVQYDPAYERAMVFLSTSEEEYLWEEERKVLLQKRRLILNRAVAIFMGILVIVLAVVFYTTRTRPPESRDSGQIANQPYAGDGQTEDARSAGDPGTGEASAEGNASPGTARGTETERDGEPVNEQEEATGQATGEDSRSVPPERDPTSSGRETDTEDRSASGRSSGRQQADGNRTTQQSRTSERASSEEVAPNRSAAERRQQALALARDVAEQSTEITRNPDLQGLLAYQAYRVNQEYNGVENDPQIYEGLYQAMKKLISPAYNIYPNMRNSVKAIEWLGRTGSILTVSSDGSVKILSGTYANIKTQISLHNTGLNNECLAVSPDERMAAVGTNGGGLLFLELENEGRIVHRSTDEGRIVLFLENLGQSGSFVSAGTDNRIIRWRYEDYHPSELAATPSRPSALAAARDGASVAFGTRDGKLYEIDVNTPANIREIADLGSNHARALVYSPGGQYLSAGLLDGSVRVMAGSGRSTIATLRGPGARVTDLAYSPNGRFLAAASHDGNVYLWNATDWSLPPLVFAENNGFVLAVCFSGNSDYFYSGSVDFPRLIVRPTSSSQMAQEFCALVGRNLTQAEWDRYLGGNLPYQETCPGKN